MDRKGIITSCNNAHEIVEPFEMLGFIYYYQLSLNPKKMSITNQEQEQIEMLDRFMLLLGRVSELVDIEPGVYNDIATKCIMKQMDIKKSLMLEKYSKFK